MSKHIFQAVFEAIFHENNQRKHVTMANLLKGRDAKLWV
ncbi:hypothetical protein EAL2_c02840 [Peptoclostridium acidaminophilum DSM 3953]|uniref:Uncharacterized protein n=1 Tax=Peptoclostridium acidaminophilum DSM 3953 TaxID=1286171 RepID=W8THC3_PEPAC|nr:hypothetical protein EAL2_c02840 [Peptoclostridium acidaminophilum DSM 3953]